MYTIEMVIFFFPTKILIIYCYLAKEGGNEEF